MLQPEPAEPAGPGPAGQDGLAGPGFYSQQPPEPRLDGVVPDQQEPHLADLAGLGAADHGLDGLQGFGIDFGSMPIHFLAEGDDPPVITIPEPGAPGGAGLEDGDDGARPALPPVRVRRNYACGQCEYVTQNPRLYLVHMNTVHDERMTIHECQHCSYASRHQQKVERHTSTVHDPNREERLRKQGVRRRAPPKPRRREEYLADFIDVVQSKQKSRLDRTSKKEMERQQFRKTAKARIEELTAIMAERRAKKREDARLARVARWAAEDKEKEAAAKAAKAARAAPTATQTRPKDEEPTDDPGSGDAASAGPALQQQRKHHHQQEGSDEDDDEDRLVINDDTDATEGDDPDEDPDDPGDPPGAEGPGQHDPDDDPYGDSDDDHDHVPDQGLADDHADDDMVNQKVRAAAGAPRGAEAEGLFRCSSCSFTSRTASLVVRHEGIVHLKRRFYRCSKCTYVTHLRSRYTKHFKYHLMPLIKCGDCDFSTPYRWNLDRHVKNHGGAGKHQCRGCNFATEIRQSLTVHQMNHHEPPIGPAHPSSKCRGQQRRKFKVGATLWTPPPAPPPPAAEPPLPPPPPPPPPPTPSTRSPPRSPAGEQVAVGASTSSSNAADRLPPHQVLRCSLCAYRTPYVSNMSRHMHGVHGSTKPVRLPPSVTTVEPSPATSPKAAAKRPVKPLPNLIPIQAVQAAPAPSPPSPAPLSAPPSAPVEPAGATNGDDGHDTSKKKNSFFDQLKLYPGAAGGASDLVCVHCGHEAKSLAELVRHNKLHQGGSRPLGTSTRCQHCRHRCKTSADLVQHLKGCVKAAAAAAPGADSAIGPEGEDAKGAGRGASGESDVSTAAGAMDNAASVAAPAAPPASEDADDEDAESEAASVPDGSVPSADPSLVGVETAPGYGLVTNQAEYEARAAKQNIVTAAVSPRKVFKCPHCPFWAATASRFHVHMVGHLNKKPFACSVCKYRSNWRWDITKHIRIKEARDPEHANAKTLMTDETGRRNYSKYNQHLLLLKVAEPSADNLTPMYNAGPSTSKAGANGSQSETNSKKSCDPVPILPAPPKLTRAPAPRSVAQGPSSSSGNLLRPPPPLQAAARPSSPSTTLPSAARGGQTSTQQHPGQAMAQPAQQQQSLKRPAETPVPNVGSDPKKPNTEIKKTVWRCKQCYFRDGDRAVVLAHVKGHYRQQQEAAMAKLKNNLDSHAQDTKSSNGTPQSMIKKPFRCDTCPFVSISESSMKAHVNCHKERSDVYFKCFYCPFYVSTKEEVIQHMTVHQQNSKGESSGSEIIATAKPSTSQLPHPSSCNSAGTEIQSTAALVTVKKEIPTFDQDAPNEETPPSKQLSPPVLDFSSLPESSLCWVLRDGKLQKMLRCRFCPHVNSRRANMTEHEKMHSKRSGDPTDAVIQHAYMCPDCSYICNNAGVLSSHMKVHYPTYPQVYNFYDPYICEAKQTKDIIAKFNLQVKRSEQTPPKLPPSKETNDAGNEKKLCGINVMSLLDPNQSLTDAVLAMKKKFNLELDGEPFAEPVDESAESLPCSPLKQLNDGADPAAMDTQDEKQLHFCHLCPARFLSRQELGIHSRFHNLYLIHKCDHCSYTARQRPHLVAHYKVHAEDYQDRTSALMKMYKVNKEFPLPRIVCANLKPGLVGNPWIVVNSSGRIDLPPAPRFGCPKCPAAFFKNDALQAHLTLHGSNNPHQCPICDYAVRTYGNLIKHMVTHGCKASVAKKVLQGRMDLPDSLRPIAAVAPNEVPLEPVIHKEEPQSPDDNANEQGEISGDSVSKSAAIETNAPVKEDVSMEIDNSQEATNCEGQLDSEMRNNVISPSESPTPRKGSGLASGSSDFVYPTSCRNGRVKVKKYKCQKCPSAFEKKDQYHIHVGLHGSKQRYKCTKCDYSVKFYANHVQHLRRHQASEEAKASSKDDSESSNNEGEESLPDDTENIPSSSSSPSPTRSAKTTGGKGEKLSVADKQAIMVLQQRRAKRSAVSRESLDKNYWCSHCPYSSPRKDLVESHMRRHSLVSGIRNAHVCDHCDYSVPIKHFLRDHTKLHFDVSKAPRPDAFMICDGLELYASSGVRKGKSKGKVLIFLDKGCSVASERFVPPLTCGSEDSNDSANKIFINPLTLESESFGENGTKEITDACGDVENSEHEELEPKHIEKPVEGLCKENSTLVVEPMNVSLGNSSVNSTVQQNNLSSLTEEN